MATANEDIKSLETLFECAVCLEKYKDPRNLQCGHHFCRKCLHGILDQQVGHFIPCPTCRSETHLPIGQGVDHLPRPVLFNEIQRKLSSLLQTSLGRDYVRKCDTCIDKISSPTYYCGECDENFCDPCKVTHDQLEGIDGHTAVPVTLLCDTHPKKKVVMYCLACNACICAKCVMGGHTTHDKQALAEAAKSSRDRLHEVIGAKGNLNDDDHIVESLKNMLSKTKDNQQKFRMATSKIHQCLREFEKRLKEEVKKTEQKFEECVEKITACYSDANFLVASKRAFIDQAERLVTEASEPELVVQEHDFPSFDSNQSVAGLCEQKVSMPHISDFEQFVLKLKDQMAFNNIKSITTTIKDEMVPGEVNLISKGSMPGLVAAKLKTTGTRVRRGKDWCWGNQDGKLPGLGTIAMNQAGVRSGWVRVEWDHGNEDQYRMGKDGKFEIILA